MAKVIYVELMDRFGRVRRRTKVDSFPAGIGRAYSNEIILDDKYVSPCHASLTLSDQGELRLHDNDSCNGVLLNRQKVEGAVIPLKSDDLIKIGESTLRIREAEHAVPAALPQHHYGLVASRLINTSYIALSCLIAGCLCVVLPKSLSNYRLITQARLIDDVITGILAVTAVAFLWSGVWALISAAVIRRGRFWTHVTIISLALIVLALGEILLRSISFALAAPTLYQALGPGLLIVVATVLLYSHLCYSSKAARMRLFAASAAVAAIGLCAFLVDAYVERSEFSTDLEFHAVLMPPEMRIVPAKSLTEFISEAEQLKRKVNALRSDSP